MGKNNFKLLIFFKGGCRKCVEMGEALPTAGADWKGIISCVYDVDTIEGLTEATIRQVYSFPCFILFKKDKEIKRWIGYVPNWEEVWKLCQKEKK